jgi:hypothetical protein
MDEIVEPRPGQACVIPGRVYWDPLGPETLCEIPNCNKLAYAVCNETIQNGEFWWKAEFIGCKRKVCMDHVYIEKS